MAVLIDCWESDVMGVDQLYYNIIEFLDATPEITIVVLASYDTDDITTDNLWYSNRLAYRAQPRKTDSVILDYINPTKLQIAMTDFDEFSNFINKHEEIENIYFMGHSWNQCLHQRPIGINACSDTGKNIIINQKCVWDGVTDNILNMEKYQSSKNYIKLKDDVYQWQNNKY